MIRRRHLLYVLAALAVPIPASAVGVGGGAPAAQPLDVAVSLDECGIAATTVVCKLDATFNSIEGARYYTAAVTGPDGSVVDCGKVSSGATSLWVPYVGDGTYSVTVSAWGEIVKDHKPKPLATDSGNTAGANHGTTATPGAGHGHAHHAGVPTHATAPGQTGAGQRDGGSASDRRTPADPPPPNSDPPPDPAPPADPGSGDPTNTPPDGSDPPPAIEGVCPWAEQSTSASGELPSFTTAPSTCPDPVTTPHGTCCPDIGK